MRNHSVFLRLNPTKANTDSMTVPIKARKLWFVPVAGRTGAAGVATGLFSFALLFEFSVEPCTEMVGSAAFGSAPFPFAT